MKDAERWLDWKGDGDNSGFIKNGAPLVNPEADGSQQGGAIKKTKYKEKPIDVKLFGLGKGWKINRSKIESLKDFAKHLEKFNKNVEKIEKEVEGIKDALTTEGSEPVIEKVGEKMVTEEGGIRTIIESQDTIKIRKIQHPI